MSLQTISRTSFANTELYNGVMDTWGTPISQPSPTVRYLKSGSNFNHLKKMAFTGQKVTVNASMNYRKRGLVYFSGFDFTFTGEYTLVNDESDPIDVVFIFPLQFQNNNTLLSDLQFEINNKGMPIKRSAQSNKISWTGRMKSQERITLSIQYTGRGLDHFIYDLDPSLPVKNFIMDYTVEGGVNYDYPHGVIAATTVDHNNDDQLHLQWKYNSFESGVPVGIILPSEKSFTAIVNTMILRAMVLFFLYYISINCIALLCGRPLKTIESYLLSFAYGFFYILLPYLAAYMNFYVAYFISIGLIVLLITLFMSMLMERRAGIYTVGILGSFLLIPTLAVTIEGYTGLIYTIEILLGLAGVMWLTTKDVLQKIIAMIALPKQEATNE